MGRKSHVIFSMSHEELLKGDMISLHIFGLNYHVIYIDFYLFMHQVMGKRSWSSLIYRLPIVIDPKGITMEQKAPHIVMKVVFSCLPRPFLPNHILRTHS